ncbi:acyltransferase family protein [Cohnella nanjingensis]|uniref:Acyltransferase family protein n=1 Tax=Cohnella nanjingensis TaxID=1387779 RepID=A0A7X0RSK2_9BACL|nr:acyltransferase family protein [Cohnella nanjingensis]MBB6672733.1 acyltransferase family protein [Cohnella nanjingensis]
MPKPNQRHFRYMPGLDGLRALAVMAVIAYHLGFGWASGGLLGVGMFFVLSGYLITDLLVAEWQRDKGINLRQFWLRRARRLLPAMLLVLAAVLIVLALFDRSRIPALQGDVWSAVTYTSNWYLIFHQVSYFESFGPPSPFGHLWSLAVEEQFYLLWPLLLLIGLRFAPRRGRLALIILGAAAVSAIAMVWIYEPGSDPSRVYYGTDTRAFGLLIGAALALIWPSAKLQPTLSRSGTLLVDLIGVGGLAAVLLMMVRIDEYDAFLYQGGMVLLSIATALVVAALAHPGGRIGGWLGWKPLRWIGVRSYGIYLWHYPVIVLTNPTVDTNGPSIWRTVLQIGVTVALAALSYKYVEDPIRRGGLRKLWERDGQGIRRPWSGRVRARLAAIFSVVALITFCVSCTGDADNHQVSAKSPPASQESGGLTTVGASKPAQPSPTPKPSPAGKGDTDAPSKVPTATPQPDSKPAEAKPPAKDQGTNPKGGAHPPAKPGTAQGAASGKGVTAIGDSVILDIEPYLEKLLPGIVIDGKIGRQMSSALEVLEQLQSDDKLGERVIIELGTNGSFTKKQLVKVLDSLQDKQQVVLVNTRVPRKWQDTVNKMLADVSKDYPNVTLVDWYAFSEDHDEYFGKDGVHLGKTGSQAYAGLVAENVQAARKEA